MARKDKLMKKEKKMLKKAEKKAVRKMAKDGDEKVDRRDIKPEFDRLP